MLELVVLLQGCCSSVGPSSDILSVHHEQRSPAWTSTRSHFSSTTVFSFFLLYLPRLLLCFWTFLQAHVARSPTYNDPTHADFATGRSVMLSSSRHRKSAVKLIKDRSHIDCLRRRWRGEDYPGNSPITPHAYNIQVDAEFNDVKGKVKLVLRRLNRNSEPQASIESGAYTYQYVSTKAPANHDIRPARIWHIVPSMFADADNIL